MDGTNLVGLKASQSKCEQRTHVYYQAAGRPLEPM